MRNLEINEIEAVYGAKHNGKHGGKHGSIPRCSNGGGSNGRGSKGRGSNGRGNCQPPRNYGCW